MVLHKGKESAIVIGIDFGTTFSGVSWAFSGLPNDIEIITRWKAQLRHNSDTEKTPSALLYEGDQRQALWGYGIPPATHDETLRWFKLLLVDQCDLPKEIRDSSQIATIRDLVEKANKDPVEVISEYLRHLWNHSIENITRSAGLKLVDLCKFHVVITLPAIWPDYAKARMRRAAENAGILEERWAGDTTLSFISEPEAAALATLRDLGKRPDIEVGDHFVVCDAGGGTVDLISYEIVKISPLVVREAVKGNGALCGGVFLDEAFTNCLKDKIGDTSWKQLPSDEVQKMLNGDWEHGIKQQFEGQEQDWPVELPVEPHASNGLRRGFVKKQTLILTREDLEPVFDRVTRQIVRLVNDQINGVFSKSHKTPKARLHSKSLLQYVLLVGGFGRCQYLGVRLQASIGTGIELLQSQGHKPWTAICRGAVIQGLTRQSLGVGLSVMVSSRISRLNYGIKVFRVYDSARHRPVDKVWCVMKQKFMAGNQTQWYIKLGENVSVEKKSRHQHVQHYMSPVDRITSVLYYSAATPAPTRGDATVKELCRITWTKKIDILSLPSVTNNIGVTYYELHFEIEMVADGTSLDFTVIYDGKPVGAKNVSVDFEPQGGEAGSIVLCRR
ncbi:Hsp70 family chaperone [Colletotrichum tofieldiae]|uniref:Hsp70 family chaperone n=1 Tax=Colletotrichum tofieldiae TaxID=708197 RepID=A0A166YMK7_9PEZI|nr:Hsp70 family chaperone [Colletotrichum tofieldiae]